MSASDDLRQRAEASLAKQGLAHRDPSRLSPDEILELVHELQVHQVELEMQNEELLSSQAALAASRDRMADLYDFAPVGYVTVDRKGKIREANLTASQLLGVPRQEMIGRRLATFVARHGWDALHVHLTAALRSGKPQQCEVELGDGDGPHRVARLDLVGHAARVPTPATHGPRGATSAEPDEAAGECRITLTDVTDRVAAERARLAAETRYRTLVETSDAIIWACDAEGRLTYLNPAAERIFGYAADESIGRRFTDFLPTQAAAAAVQSFESTMTGQHVKGYQVAVAAKDGRQVHLVVNARQVLDADGRVAGATGTATDITLLKQAEAALRQLNAELEGRVADRTAEVRQALDAAKAERQRLYGVLETLPAYVVLLDKDYRAPFANRYFRERFGESHGRCCFDYLFHRTEPCENCETYKVLKTHAPHDWQWTGPDQRDYDVHDFPFTDADGTPLILEMGIDVTERNRAEAALRELNATLERRVAERTAELQATNEDLARFNRAAVDRELRMIQLKKQINELCAAAGQPPRYTLRSIEEQP